LTPKDGDGDASAPVVWPAYKLPGFYLRDVIAEVVKMGDLHAGDLG